MINLNWDVNNSVHGKQAFAESNLISECLCEIEKCKLQSIAVTFLVIVVVVYNFKNQIQMFSVAELSKMKYYHRNEIRFKLLSKLGNNHNIWMNYIYNWQLTCQSQVI